jgi:aconitate hydratase
MLVVTFALAGRIDVDLRQEPLGLDPNGKPVYLKEIWPAETEIRALIDRHVKEAFYKKEYGRIFDGDEFWRDLPDAESTTFPWAPNSTYIKRPPYFEDFPLEPPVPAGIEGARALMLLGDSVTTDHISPAGAIPAEYPAGRYLIEQGVAAEDFNSYGSRRGNHEVMMRGTFGNIRIKNRLVAPQEGSYTLKQPEGEKMYVYEAAMRYANDETPLVVLAGKEYGSGSSRDWAAKGSLLLGVRAVIAQSFERIHRSNLVGMGVLPMVFKPGDSIESLGLDGSETFTIRGLEKMTPRCELAVEAVKADGAVISFEVVSRLDTEIELDYYRHGGILAYVLRQMIARS